MKNSFRYVLALVLLAGWSVSVLAQGDAGVSIRKINHTTKERAPTYKTSPTTAMQQGEWFHMQVEYETKDPWMDQLDFVFYVVLENKKATKDRYKMYRSRISYADIERGKHLASVYMHPSTLKRYGEVNRVGVLIYEGGRLLTFESDPKNSKRWWEQLTPIDGYILKRTETPFAMLESDNYEFIRRTPQSR